MLQLTSLNTLRFKASLFSLLLVVAMCLFFILLGNGSLQSLLDKSRESRYLSFQNQISGLMVHSRQEAQQLAELVVHNERGRIASRDELRKVMNRQWELLQHNWRLHSLKIYSAGAEPTFTWGSPHSGLSSDEVAQVLLRGQPLERVYCEHSCVQSVALPVRASEGDYVLQIDRALSQLLERFRTMTGSEIGIISSERLPAQADGANYVEGWQREVLALTSRDRLLPMLAQVAEREGLERLHFSRFYPFANREYDIRVMPVDVGGEGAHFVFIDDVTEEAKHISASVKLLFLFSVLGALIFSAAVAGTLWRPIVRLRRLAQALPLLTNGRFDDARRLIQPVHKDLNKFDELDVLDNTGLTVCDQLEDMNDMVSRKTAQLERIAMHDSLTGLDNRYSLLEQLEHYLDLQRRATPGQREQGYLFFIDLDDFKQVNDTLGHQGGDELLCVLARRLLSVMRCGDIVARLGGDEFCVFVRDLPEADAYRSLAAKMLKTVAQPVKIIDHMVAVTMSVGVVGIDEQGDTLESILQKADMAMYHAKRNGKNKYHLFSTDLPEGAEVCSPESPSKSSKIKGAQNVATLELISNQPR